MLDSHVLVCIILKSAAKSDNVKGSSVEMIVFRVLHETNYLRICVQICSTAVEVC